MSIKCVSSFVGPAGGAGGGSLLKRFTLHQGKGYESDKDKVKCGLMKDLVTDVGSSLRPWGGDIQGLDRWHWVINRRSIHDDRALCLWLSRQGEVVARKIKNQVDTYETEMERSNMLRVEWQKA